MRILKCAAVLSLLVFATSCYESLPEDQSDRFAATVVYDLYKNTLQLPLTDISTMHKASEWLDNIDDDNARYEIEDIYFSKIAPRAKDNVVVVIPSTSGDEIRVAHNNVSIVDAGAVWSISADDSASSKKITISNIDGEQWLCTQEEPNGEISIRLTVKWSGVDNYIFTVDGDRDVLYTNTPVAAQHYANTSTLAAKARYRSPYPIGSPLSIVDGKLKIELIDATQRVIEGDDIDVTFQNSGAASPSYDYYDNTFNPLISFRGKKFYYGDLYLATDCSSLNY